MRIFHTSDIHMNSPLTARLTGNKIKERKAELIAGFSLMVDEAIYQNAKLFIIAGDLFDSEKISVRVRERVLGIIERAAEIDFLYLSGNHERAALTENVADLPRNLRLFGEEWTYFDYDYVTVAGRSELNPKMFTELNLDSSKKNIVVLHGALSDRCSESTVGIKDAEGRYIDYLALGHYHTHSVHRIDDRGIAVYSGTPEGRGFDETGDKGFILIDTDGKRLDYKFIPFAKRRLDIISVDITGISRRLDIEDRVREALGKTENKNLVRIRLTGKRPPELYADTEELTRLFADGYYHFEVKDESGIEIDPEDYRYDKSLKGEFIRLVMSKRELTDDERDLIIRTGIGALMGELTDV